MSIQGSTAQRLFTAQNLFDILNTHSTEQFAQLSKEKTKANELCRFFQLETNVKHTDNSTVAMRKKVTETASIIHALIVAGRKIANLENLLNQAIEYLDRSPLSLTSFGADVKFTRQCLNLYETNVTNVTKLRTAYQDARRLNEEYQKVITAELLPSFEKFAAKFAVSSQDSNSPVNEPATATISASTGILNAATATVSGLFGNLFSLAYSPSKVEYSYRNYINQTQTHPQPEPENLVSFFNRRQTQASSSSLEASEEHTEADKISFRTEVYQKLHSLCECNYRHLYLQWSGESGIQKLYDKLEKARNAAGEFKGSHTEGKAFAKEHQKDLNDFGIKIALYRIALKALIALEHFLIEGKNYLELHPFSTEERETLKILDNDLLSSIDQIRIQEFTRFEVIEGDLKKVSELKNMMEGACNLAEKMYHFYRYQLQNLQNGYAATLGPLQLKDVQRSYISDAESNLPKAPMPTVILKNFNSRQMELLLARDPESCLEEVIKRVHKVIINESGTKIEDEQGWQVY